VWPCRVRCDLAGDGVDQLSSSAELIDGQRCCGSSRWWRWGCSCSAAHHDAQHIGRAHVQPLHQLPLYVAVAMSIDVHHSSLASVCSVKVACQLPAPVCPCRWCCQALQAVCPAESSGSRQEPVWSCGWWHSTWTRIGSRHTGNGPDCECPSFDMSACSWALLICVRMSVCLSVRLAG
jgi:hypothetical protein